MPKEVKLKAQGLYTHPNQLDVPDGALTTADNVIIRREGILEPRRGNNTYGSSLANLDRIFNYQNTLLVKSTAGTLYYDNAGTWTALSGTFTTLKAYSAQANKDFFFSNGASTIGVYKMDAFNSAPVLSGTPKSTGVDRSPSTPSLTGTGGFLSDGNQCAYRVMFSRRDANNTDIPGAVSQRVIVANATGTTGYAATVAKNVILSILIPSGVTNSTVVRVYRSSQVVTTIEPSDELQLVYEALVTDGDITAGTKAFTDIVTDGLRGATIYTAPSQEGIEQNSDRPPASVDIATFKDCLFFANTVQPYRMFITLLSTGGTTGLQDGDILTLGNTAFTAKTTPAASTDFKLETGGSSVSIDVRNTCLNLCSVINKTPTANINAFYVSAENDPPGRILLEARDFSSPNLVPSVRHATGGTAGQRGAWFPLLNPLQTNTVSLARAGSTVTATFSTPAWHNFQNGERVTLSGGNTDFPNGEKVITGVTASTFTYTESGAAPGTNPASALFTLTKTISASNDAAPNRVHFSKQSQPEAVPLLNFLDIGRKDSQILRIVPLRDSLFVFKDDGVFRIVGDHPSNFNFQLFDPTIQLLASDSAVTLGNQIYCLTSQGVTAIADTGAEIVSRPIEKTLNDLKSTVTVGNLSTYSYGIGYETERNYELRVPTTSGDTKSTQAYIFNTLTRAWVRDTITSKFGFVSPTDDLRYLVGDPGNLVLKERKAFSYLDYSDPPISVTISSVNSVAPQANDSRTLALWRFDEAAATDNAVDATGNYTATKVSDPAVVAGKVSGGRNCAQTGYFTNTLNATFRTAMTGDVTWESWVYLNSTASTWGIQEMFHVGLDDSPAYTTRLGVYIEVDGGDKFLGVFWTDDQGTNITHLDINSLSNDVWQHLAVVRKWNGAAWDIFMYRNGVELSHLYSASTRAVSTTGSPELRLGVHRGTTFNNFNGRLDDMRISTQARPASEILADATTSGTITLASATGVKSGDILIQGGLNSRISAVNGNVLTMDDTLNYTSGAATIASGITSTIQYAPVTGGDPAIWKVFQETNFLMGNAHIPTVDVSHSTELSASLESQTADVKTRASQWSNAATPWDGTERPFNLRLLTPQEKRRATRLNVKWTHQNAWAHYNISGVSVVMGAGSERTSR